MADLAKTMDGVCLSAALTAAQEIATAIAVFPRNHLGQGHLNRALHNALIIAEQQRQAHKADLTAKPADDGGDDA